MVPDRLQWQIDNNFSNASIAVALVGGLAAAGTVGAVGNVIGGETAAKGAPKAASTEPGCGPCTNPAGCSEMEPDSIPDPLRDMKLPAT